MAANDPEGQARIFAELIGRLKAAGAKTAAVTSMGGHFCIEQLKAISPLPLINAIPELNDQFGRMGVKRIGILGSGAVMRSKFYGGVTSVEIAAQLGMSARTVNQHVDNVADKLGTRNRAHTVAEIVRRGLL